MLHDAFTTDTRSTALLGEKVRSELTGYRISLATHPAASTTPAGRSAVIVEVVAQVLEVVLWLDAKSGAPGTIPDLSAEVRVVLRDAAHQDAIAEVVGDAREVSPGDLTDVGGDAVDDILMLADELIGELHTLILELAEPNLVRALEQALHVYANDRFV